MAFMSRNERVYARFTGHGFDIDDPIGGIVAIIGSALILGYGIYSMSNEGSKTKNDNQATCNVITSYWGKIIRKDGLTREEEDEESKYAIRLQNDKALVIYVYGNDEIERDYYTSFIESNIYVVEENGKKKFYLDEENLTEENYVAFVDNLLEQENGTQRTRG